MHCKTETTLVDGTLAVGWMFSGHEKAPVHPNQLCVDTMQHPVLPPISTSVSHWADSCPRPCGQNVRVSSGQSPFACIPDVPTPDRLAPLWHWPYGSTPPSLLLIPSPLLSNSPCFPGGHLFTGPPSKYPSLQRYSGSSYRSHLFAFTHSLRCILLTMTCVVYFWRELI